jgi:solute carrier family 39 (zinc transporter), member 9
MNKARTSSTLMLICCSSFLAGILPLALSLSTRQLRLITALGTGVLVGTSLIVIIPEGIETLYEASGSTHSHSQEMTLLAARSVPSLDTFPGSLKHDTWRSAQEVRAVPVDLGLVQHAATTFFGKRQDSPQEEPDDQQGTQPSPDASPEDAHDDDHDDTHAAHDPHAWVGVSLITGFILMYLIDTLPRHASGPSQPQRFHISLNSLSLTRSRTSSVPETPTTANTQSQAAASRPSSTTLGLVIHACADGIALGASSTSTSGLSFIIFLALMIHKAPAAFGLTSVLLKQGLSKRAARAHLIVFSLAAPVGALFTWGAAHILGYQSSTLSNSTSTEFATGVLLLFSAGTFLYVAMHTMQEGSAHGHSEGEEQMNGYASVPMSDMSDMYASSGPPQQRKESGGLTDTAVCVVGMLLPLLTQFGHVH